MSSGKNADHVPLREPTAIQEYFKAMCNEVFPYPLVFSSDPIAGLVPPNIRGRELNEEWKSNRTRSHTIGSLEVGIYATLN